MLASACSWPTKPTHAVDAGRIEAAVRCVLADADCDAATISVAVVDDATIHGLNRQFLEHD